MLTGPAENDELQREEEPPRRWPSLLGLTMAGALAAFLFSLGDRIAGGFCTGCAIAFALRATWPNLPIFHPGQG